MQTQHVVAGRPRKLVPISDAPEDAHASELRRAHQQIAALRARLDTVERVLHAACVLLSPYGKSNGPARTPIGFSDSGEPRYATNDDQAGAWSPEQLVKMDQKFAAAIKRELPRTHKRPGAAKAK
jgi:hypothetical protein